MIGFIKRLFETESKEPETEDKLSRGQKYSIENPERHSDDLGRRNLRLGANYGLVDITEPFYAYKATRNGIVRLIIPKGATVVVPKNENNPVMWKKLRADKAYVDKIATIYKVPRGPGTYHVKGREARQSIHDPGFRYREGEYVSPDNFKRSAHEACAGGIHFFRTLESVEKWHRTHAILPEAKDSDYERAKGEARA